MFGYVVANKDELKIKEYKVYRSYYCGLCHALRVRHGVAGQMTLNFDMVFLALLLSGLYEPKTTRMKQRCIAHPLEKHEIRCNEMLDYVADMNVLLAYHNLRDDWMDDGKVSRKIASDLLRRRYRKTADRYPEQVRAITEYLEKLHRVERKESANLDEAAGLTGEMMQALFAYKKDEWEASLRTIGFYLGKFIYLLDAYDDLWDDKKNHNYNVWKSYEDRPDFDDYVEHILDMMMTQCSKEFEVLPILQDVNLIRNILYAGVFTRYTVCRKKREDRRNAGSL